jgi:hypothetical protein
VPRYKPETGPFIVRYKGISGYARAVFQSGLFRTNAQYIVSQIHTAMHRSLTFTMQGLVKAYSLFVILRADAEYTHPND